MLSVPDGYREGSFALGAGRLRTIFRIVLAHGHPRYPGGRHTRHRPHRWRDGGAHLHPPAPYAQTADQPVFPGAHAVGTHVCALQRGGCTSIRLTPPAAVLLIVVVVGINALSAAVAKSDCKEERLTC